MSVNERGREFREFSLQSYRQTGFRESEECLYSWGRRGTESPAILQYTRMNRNEIEYCLETI